MNIEDFEKCFVDIYNYKPSTDTEFHDWFMKNHLAYHGSYDLLSKKRECLRDIYDMWIKENRQPIYFWLSTGIKCADKDITVISASSIKLLDSKVRQLYRNESLNNILQ